MAAEKLRPASTKKNHSPSKSARPVHPFFTGKMKFVDTTGRVRSSRGSTTGTSARNSPSKKQRSKATSTEGKRAPRGGGPIFLFFALVDSPCGHLRTIADALSGVEQQLLSDHHCGPRPLHTNRQEHGALAKQVKALRRVKRLAGEMAQIERSATAEADRTCAGIMKEEWPALRIKIQ